jgi:ferredoxin
MHEGEYSIYKARIGIESYYENGQELKYKDSFCILCGKCSRECPESAININDKLELDAEKCTGCGICAENCPKKVIKMYEELPLLCDTCDGAPACVSVCPHGALGYS